MSETTPDTVEVKKNSSGLKSLVIAALLMGAIAAAAGWFLGSQIGTNMPNSSESYHTKTDLGENKLSDNAANSAILPLVPILTNLDSAEKIWVRLEASLIIKENEALTPEQQAEISNDFIALLRQMSLLQIKGPTGLMNLREDLLDRARIKSEGKVSAVLISNLVIE